jgi:hypothetical protein
MLSCGEDFSSDPWLSGAGGSPAVLTVCRPRWPLRRLLVIVRGDRVDELALAWAARLARPARPGGAAVAALMVAAPSPGAPGRHELAEEGIASLLLATSAAGHKMKRIASRLADLRLDSALHLRQGLPERAIHDELAAGDYDLVIAGIAERGWEAQWRLRPLLGTLLVDLRCPLLIVFPSATGA